MLVSRILLVDDEKQIHRFLGPALDAAGYTTEHAASGAEGLRLAAAHAPALVLLDLGLPDLDGQEVLRRLRGFSPVPVIVLSARDRDEEKVRALDEGADDFVEKPFSVSELLARIRAALRRSGDAQDTAPPPLLRVGAVEIDVAAHRVMVDGMPAGLSPREFALLALLARHAGRVMTHRQILVALWGPAHAEDTQYLRVYIGQLRQKLGPDGPRLITTEPGIGYRLEATAP
ncbi:response regulator transcription factor [Acetobacteraceae bacterium KSS8]|uniref:Response regulator transcription factor n=1 Tax=Endosaccharibacter trunci TaxID=2812733 RepID=A0ABT1W654_9PROT|nr:response regulator transcription factor [Acetobacteraceae bacterium KSS8]